MRAAQQLKRYYDPEDLCGEEWELNDEETFCTYRVLPSLCKLKENSPT